MWVEVKPKYTIYNLRNGRTVESIYYLGYIELSIEAININSVKIAFVFRSQFYCYCFLNFNESF